MKALIRLACLATAVSLLVLPVEARSGKSIPPPTTAVSTELGTTKVQFDDAFLTELDTLNITLSRLGPCTLFPDGKDSDRKGSGRKHSGRKGKNSEGETSATFLIVGGIYDPVASTAEILHRGGLILKTADTVVVLSSFIVDLTDSDAAVLSGLVTENGSLKGRMPLFKIVLTDSTTNLLSCVLKISDITLTLTSEAASALNSAFTVDAFAADDPVGKANIIAILRFLNQGSSFEPPTHDDNDDCDDDDNDHHDGDDDGNDHDQGDED